MKIVLGTNGEIGLPPELRAADHLGSGDQFEIERLRPGQYMLSRVVGAPGPVAVGVGADGLPVIRASGAITSALVREIEGLTS